jgi:hypothetical protein
MAIRYILYDHDADTPNQTSSGARANWLMCLAKNRHTVAGTDGIGPCQASRHPLEILGDADELIRLRGLANLQPPAPRQLRHILRHRFQECRY